MISWRVENSFRFFTDAADTEVHRATFLALPPEQQLRHPDARRRAGAEPPPRGRLGGDHVPRHLLGRAHEPLRLHGRQRLHQSEIAPRRSLRINNVDEAAGSELHVAHRAARRRALRGKVVTQPCSEQAQLRRALSRRRHGRGGDRRPRGGDRERSRHGSPHRRHGRQLRLRRRQSRTCRCAFRASAPPTTASAQATGRSHRLSGAHRAVEADRRQGVHRGECALERSGAATARSIRISCARRCSSASRTPHRAVTYVGVACSGSEVDLRPVPALHRQRVGAQPAATCRRFPPSPRPSAAMHEAPMQDLPEAYHMDGTIPELKGGLVLRKCDPDQRAQDRPACSSPSAATTSASRGCSPTRCCPINRCCASSAAGSARCTASTTPSTRLDALILRYKSLNRAIHYLLHIPWEESDRVLLTAYPGLALLGDGTRSAPTARRHGRAARFRARARPRRVSARGSPTSSITP